MEFLKIRKLIFKEFLKILKMNIHKSFLTLNKIVLKMPSLMLSDKTMKKIQIKAEIIRFLQMIHKSMNSKNTKILTFIKRSGYNLKLW
jgi:hypothetical protein